MAEITDQHPVVFSEKSANRDEEIKKMYRAEAIDPANPYLR
jgi:hypothetical protein